MLDVLCAINQSVIISGSHPPRECLLSVRRKNQGFSDSKKYWIYTIKKCSFTVEKFLYISSALG